MKAFNNCARRRITWQSLLLCALCAFTTWAQRPPRHEPPPPDGMPPPHERRGEHEGRQFGPPPGAPPFGFTMLSSELFSDGKVIKGAPFSATAVTETMQTLGDGTRIARKMSAQVWRDSEGRTRREHTLEHIGMFPVAGEPPQLAFIHNPVNGTRTMLDLKQRTARKLPVGDRPAGRPDDKRANADSARTPLAPGKTESLGKQMIEGVEATGTRSTVTIPVGQIGNDRALEIVTERWESAELQCVIFSKHRDPRLGETVYRLTNLQRSDPAANLFEVPADFKLLETRAPNGKFSIHVEGGKRRKPPEQ